MNPPAPRIQRRRSRRRQRLIEAARRIIIEKGLANFTIQDVTEAADMAVGSFYTYFPNKDALIEAAIWEDLQALGDPNRPELAGLDPEERRRQQLLQAFQFIETHRDLFGAVFGPNHIPEHFERGMDLLEQRVAEGLRTHPQLPPQLIQWVSPLIAGMIAGAIRYLLRHPDVSAETMTYRMLALLRPLSDQIHTPPQAPSDPS